MAGQQQDVETLKRRGRRRLVGAVALVLAAVIVLPMVFDPEPRNAPPVSVSIPGEDDGAFKPKEKKAERKAEPKAPPKAAETAAVEQYVIPVGAFSNADSVLARLKEANLPYYTEQVAIAKGAVTRVRAGPFPSREAADQALERLKALGFKPGSVAAKSG